MRHLLHLRGPEPLRLAPRLRRTHRTRLDFATGIDRLLSVDYPNAEKVVP